MKTIAVNTVVVVVLTIVIMMVVVMMMMVVVVVLLVVGPCQIVDRGLNRIVVEMSVV